MKYVCSSFSSVPLHSDFYQSVTILMTDGNHHRTLQRCCPVRVFVFVPLPGAKATMGESSFESM